MSIAEWQLLYDEYAIMKGIKKDIPVNRLERLFDMPESRPTKSIKHVNKT